MREGVEAWLASQNMALSVTVTDRPLQTGRGAQAGLLAQARPLGTCRRGPRRAWTCPTTLLGAGKGRIRFARAGHGCCRDASPAPSQLCRACELNPSMCRQDTHHAELVQAGGAAPTSTEQVCSTAAGSWDAASRHLHPDVGMAQGGGIAKGDFPSSVLTWVVQGGWYPSGHAAGIRRPGKTPTKQGYIPKKKSIWEIP